MLKRKNALALIVITCCISFSSGAVIWSEDFSGINDAVQTDPAWNGEAGLLESRNGLIKASDTKDDGSPAAFTTASYSVDGAVYTTVPQTNNYTLTGNVIDYANSTDRNNRNYVRIEANYNTSTHEKISNGWGLRLERFTAGHNSIYIYNPAGERVKELYIGVNSQVLHIPFEFKRTGDNVEITYGDLTYSATDTYNPDNDQLSLYFWVQGYGSGYTETGWSDFQMVPEPATMAIFALGGLFVSSRRKK
ncbi:hypothetical protein SMSP2_00871 [Limihaloglobus sulfuriphilus]|uniref:Ice-binding protein C-terminal domain-containing protein n=1 Tax=Limihaloglobus sulfuriphilus TaxID=1851148 RepID=A0A1Q2MCZ0_9BACT|nr:PEP-CTERM sorting domain-containing protein [Limihaloglobus sulfuriphilus]AQQ70519.1 hypothetical protein SMSP2_00871 [Limihaloglobus sulfuriphilus]